MTVSELIIALIEASNGDVTREVGVYDLDADNDYISPVIEVNLDADSHHVVITTSVQ